MHLIVLAESLPISWPGLIAAVGAVITAISGCFLSYAAIIKAKNEGQDNANQECQDNLRQARLEAEHLANELHKLRMEE